MLQGKVPPLRKKNIEKLHLRLHHSRVRAEWHYNSYTRVFASSGLSPRSVFLSLSRQTTCEVDNNATRHVEGEKRDVELEEYIICSEKHFTSMCGEEKQSHRKWQVCRQLFLNIYICARRLVSLHLFTSFPLSRATTPLHPSVCRWWISTFSPLLHEEKFFVCKKFMRTFSLSICLRREYTVLCKHQFWCFCCFFFLGKVNIFSWHNVEHRQKHV